MNPNSKVKVLLASYNGGCFIEQQIESIFSQQGVNVSLVIRDDGSTDNSIMEISNKYANNKNCTILANESSVHGHLSNFGALCEFALEEEDTEYLAFSDQDDIWHEKKLKTCVERLQQLEAELSSDIPILIHTDLRVVDQNLVEIAPSFIKYQGIPSPQNQSFESFLHQNVATGCTFVFNRALLELATPIPKGVVIHDWWFALVAKFYGVIAFIDQPLIDYRQHDSNSIGAISAEQQRNFKQKHIYMALMRYPKHLAASIIQAKALSEVGQRQHKKSHDVSELVEFQGLADSSFLAKIKYVNTVLAKSKPIEEKIYYYLIMVLLPFLRKKR